MQLHAGFAMMQSIISTTEPVISRLTHEWYGKPVNAPVEFSFTLEGDFLVFQAAQCAWRLLAHWHEEAIPHHD